MIKKGRRHKAQGISGGFAFGEAILMEKQLTYNRCRSGFTLAELVIGITVLGIILAVSAGLAFAMNSAERVTDEMVESQLHVRYATMRISELIGSSNMIFATSYLHNGIAIWRDGDGDGRIDSAELVYVEHDVAKRELNIVDYPNTDGTVMVDDVESGSARRALENTGNGRYTALVSNCGTVVFPAGSPVCDLVSMQFTTEEDGRDKVYQISARKMVSMDYLLDESGELKSGDDDL